MRQRYAQALIIAAASLAAVFVLCIAGVRAAAHDEGQMTPTPATPPATIAPADAGAAQYPTTTRHAQTPSPSPGPSGAPGPQTPAPSPTPPPGFGRITADRVYGKTSGDMDADGHVVIVSGDSSITADRAHYDAATHTVHAAGHVHYVSATGDSATAQSLEYDVARDRIIMDGVEGQTSSVAYQSEPIHGFLYYKGKRITIDHNGHAVLQNGWVTTCDLHHVAYHLTGKEIEIRPSDRLIARSPALYLGKYLVAGLGILVVPLNQEGARRPTAIAPRIGYNSIYGFFIKNYINFYGSPYFYGTYHLDYFQKAGIGFGADFYFARRDGLGSGELTVYNLRSNGYQQSVTGLKNSFSSTLTYQRMFAHRITLSANASYNSQTLLTSIPPTLSANVNVTHNGARSSTSYGGTATTTGANSSFGALLNHNVSFSPVFSENVSLQLQWAQVVSEQGTLLQSSTFARSILFTNDTRYSARAFDADLVISTNHGQTTNTTPTQTLTTPVIGLQRVPELTIRSRPFSITNLRMPVQITLIDGVYDDQYDNVTTARHEINGQLGSAIYRIGDSATLNVLAGVRQDLYGTGDERGAITEQLSLQKFFGRHADNTLAYQDQSVRGYTPLRSFDLLSGFDQINDVLNVYNGSAYRFTASTNYDFKNKFLGSINYQLSVLPTVYSNVLLGDSYDPHGGGYGPLNITVSTPLGRNDYLQFLGNYDFKLHGLEGQNYFLTHNVNDCYQIRIAYRQALHEVDVSVNLLAFPSQAINFGLTGSSLLPQSFGSP